MTPPLPDALPDALPDDGNPSAPSPAPAFRRAWRLPLADAVRGRRALWWTAGPAGELAVLLVHRRHLTRARHVKGRPGRSPRTPFDAELVTVSGRGGEHRLPLADVRMRPGHLAVLPDGRFLLAGGRTFPGADGVWAPNATVFSPEGVPEREFCVGDDIAALTTDRRGGIWTVHGDEGVYGGHPESGAGLAGWDDRGGAVWGPRGRLPAIPLQGCTAATEGDRVWTVWYSGGGRKGAGTFLTQIDPPTGEVTTWPSPVHQPDGLAVRGTRAVLTRRVHGRRAVDLTRAELRGSTWTVTERRRIRVPGRVVLRCAQGRDGFLWLRAGDTWLRVGA
ncbi:hypothetical protein ACVW0K_000516 [Streptomyces filamentosus]